MANWGDTVATMDEALKTDELEMEMIDSIYHGSNVNVMFKERGGRRAVGGKSSQAIWPVDSEQGFGAAGLAEGGTLALGRPDYAKLYKLTLADYSFAAEVTRKAVATNAKRGATYVVDLMAKKVAGILNNTSFLMGIRAFEGGDGDPAQITAISSDTLTVGVDKVKRLRRGVRVTVRNANDGTGIEQLTNPSDGTTDGGRIIDVDREAGTITIEDATGAAITTDYVYINDMHGNTEIQGLQSIISQSGTFQNLDRSVAGHSFAKAWRVNGGASALSVTMLMNARNRIPQFSPDKNVEELMIVCSYDSTIDIYDLVSSGIRFSDNRVMDVGFEAMRIHTTAGPTLVVPDQYCINNVIYMFRPNVFGWAHPEGQEGGKWVDEDGSIWKLKTSATGGRRDDSLQAFRDLRTNLYCDKPQHTVLLDNWT